MGSGPSSNVSAHAPHAAASGTELWLPLVVLALTASCLPDRGAGEPVCPEIAILGPRTSRRPHRVVSVSTPSAGG
jgi:hypothetical protein